MSNLKPKLRKGIRQSNQHLRYFPPESNPLPRYFHKHQTRSLEYCGITDVLDPAPAGNPPNPAWFPWARDPCKTLVYTVHTSPLYRLGHQNGLCCNGEKTDDRRRLPLQKYKMLQLMHINHWSLRINESNPVLIIVLMQYLSAYCCRIRTEQTTQTNIRILNGITTVNIMHIASYRVVGRIVYLSNRLSAWQCLLKHGRGWGEPRGKREGRRCTYKHRSYTPGN